ncbi:MAG: hypothetical protein N2248_06625 [candidate division WOR-3 bacterium]|uniref:Alpha/beta hydrolase n=1 Tax=candidate division WOR-3 bacterium TaxID=2052148 RepID=A0A7C1NBU9_UNCW3|nr:hypothetical protein [candidate division WOR-3 bacterium]
MDFSRLHADSIDADVVLVLHFGGWGNVPLALAGEFVPLVSGVERYFQIHGFRTLVASYRRAPADFPDAPDLGVQLAVVTEMFGFHKTRVRRFAVLLETLAVKNPDVHFILLGQSNGAIFVDEAIKLLSSRFANRVAGIVAGMPFWKNASGCENILYLDNEGNDELTKGEVGEIFGTVLQRLYQRMAAVLGLRIGRYERIWYLPSHDYDWQQVEPAVTAFLDRLQLKKSKASSVDN